MSFASLKKSIEILSWPPEQQISYLDSIGFFSKKRVYDPLTNIDEIALQFEDEFTMLASHKDIIPRNSVVHHNICGLNEFISISSGDYNSKLWTISALNEENFWFEIRKKSKIILNDLLKIELELP